MANYPGPYELRVFYVTSEPAAIADHQCRFSLDMDAAADPGDPFADWSVTEKDGSPSDLESITDALVVLLKALFNADVDITHAELWEYSPGTFDSVFRSTYAIAVAGTAAAATINFSQAVLTFRTVGGGIAKIDLRGTGLPASATLAYPSIYTAVNALMAAMVNAQAWWLGRDGTYALAPLRQMFGQNEQAFKKVNR